MPGGAPAGQAGADAVHPAGHPAAGKVPGADRRTVRRVGRGLTTESNVGCTVLQPDRRFRAPSRGCSLGCNRVQNIQFCAQLPRCCPSGHARLETSRTITGRSGPPLRTGAVTLRRRDHERAAGSSGQPRADRLLTLEGVSQAGEAGGVRRTGGPMSAAAMADMAWVKAARSRSARWSMTCSRTPARWIG